MHTLFEVHKAAIEDDLPSFVDSLPSCPFFYASGRLSFALSYPDYPYGRRINLWDLGDKRKRFAIETETKL